MAEKFDYSAFIADRVPAGAPARNPNRPKYDFGTGFPDPGSFPMDGLHEALGRALKDKGRDLVLYPDPQGHPEMREFVVQKLSRERGMSIHPDQVLMTGGSGPAIALFVQLLTNPGDVLLTEDYTYVGTLTIMRNLHARIVGIETDEQGMVPESLERTIQELARFEVTPKMIYTIPTFQNPLGSDMGRNRRQEILAVAQKYGIPIYEDDAYEDLNQAAARIAAARTVDEILRIATGSARALVRSHMSMASLTVDGSWAQAVSSVSLSDKYRDWDADVAPPNGSGIYRLVCESNQPLRLTQQELEQHEAWRTYSEHSGRHPPLRGLLAVPLVARDGANLGVIQLSDKHEGDYDEDDEALIVQLAQVASGAIERTRVEELYYHAQKLEAIGQFAGGVAHDLNNVLMAISADVSFALEELNPADTAAREDLLEAQRGARRAAELTGQLLAFARKQPLRLELVDLNEVVGATERLLRRVLPPHIALQTTLEPRLPLIRGDRGQFEQVVMNLLVNSRDAMPSGGKLLVETSTAHLDEIWAEYHRTVPPGDYVALTVADTGTGMDAETRRRAFEPFFTTKPPGQGTGLGLPTVYGIVRQCGGDVVLYSEPGQGAVVKVYLPPASASASNQVAS